MRKIKTIQEKKKNRKKIILGIFIILIIGGSCFGLWKFVFSKMGDKPVVEVKILDSFKDYDYTLSDRDSSYFKSEFKNLKKILQEKEIDEEAYVMQVAKMFTIDLYTLSTKVNKYDVGGIEYFYKNRKDMFSQKVMDTLYSTMLDDTYGDRKQELPEVKEILNPTIEKTTYTLGETDVEAYLVKLEISYKKDMGYDTEASLIICKEDGVRWSVVDFQPTLNPIYT